MIFTAYFDESGTHSGSNLSVMAGFVGNSRQWRKFQKRVGKLFGRYGVDVFHSVDLRRTDKDFRGWPVDHKLKFLDEFLHIINETLERGVTVFIRDDDYRYYRNLSWPKGTRRDSKYGLLFRGCLSHMIDVVGNIQNVFEPRLHVVLERGHTNAQDAVRIYDWAVERIGPSRALAELSFGSKKDSLPLAAADMFAYGSWSAKVGSKPLGLPKGPAKSDLSYRGNLFRVELNRDSLDVLYDQAITHARRSFSGERSS